MCALLDGNVMKNFDKFTDWLANNHIGTLFCLVVTTMILIGIVIIPIFFLFPYLLILIPIMVILYTIHLYRKGDWK